MPVFAEPTVYVRPKPTDRSASETQLPREMANKREGSHYPAMATSQPSNVA